MNASRNRCWTWGWQAAVLGLVLATGFGCSPSLLWFLNRGEEKTNAEHPLSARDGRKEIVVAVSVSSQHGNPAGVDLDLAERLGWHLKTLTEANKGTPIRLIDQNKVNAFVTNNPDKWALGNAGEFAQRVGADYWIDATVVSFSLMDKEFGGEICRGRALVDVRVFEAGQTKVKYQYTHQSQASLRSNDVGQKNLYRNKYVDQLATELAFKHVNHTADQARAMTKQ